MTSKGVFWATAAVHCVATFAVVLTVMGWTMTFLDTGRTQAPTVLQVLSIVRLALVWPILYPLARLALSLGYSDPLAPVYWLLPPVNNSVVGLFVAGVHRWAPTAVAAVNCLTPRFSGPAAPAVERAR
jgi:hypothetical protein